MDGSATAIVGGSAGLAEGMMSTGLSAELAISCDRFPEIDISQSFSLGSPKRKSIILRGTLPEKKSISPT